MKQDPVNIMSFSGGQQTTRKLLNSLNTGVIILGPKAEILFSNELALNMLGLTEEELCSLNHPDRDMDVVQEDGSPFPRISHPAPIAILTKKPVYKITMGIRKPDTKDRVWLLVDAEPLLDENSNVREVICSFHDITERKAVEEKLTWLYQDLEIRAFELARSNADLERFLYVATHDLQEPLRSVSSFMELLKNKYENQLDEQANEYISHAVKGARFMKRLILDLLAYSNLRHPEESFVLTDLDNVVKKLVLGFSFELKAVGAQMIIAPLPAIKADPVMMSQLFENLIANAIKYRSTRNLLIQVDWKEEKDNFLFSVRDNGIGIDPQYADKIFILFKRLHHDIEIYDGTGVGLAICRKIVDIHRGNIWVVSEPGVGSTFHFTIAREQN